jgi:hypothetical protein
MAGILRTDVEGDLPLEDLAPEDLIKDWENAEDLLAFRARFDPAVFAAYVLRDEETNKPIKLTPMHKEWHMLASTYKRTLIWAHVEAGKSQQMSIARALWEIGRNPNIRIVIASNTASQAVKICMTIAKYITDSKEFAKVFPGISRAKGLPWTQSALFVTRTTKAKDPTVQVCGVHGNILGSRVDLLIIDDILDYESTISATQREDLWNWFHSTLEGRLTRNARVICIGTAWHREDAMHRWAKRPDFFAVRYPVIDDDMTPTWDDRWPMGRITEKRMTLGPVEFNRQLLCVARTDEKTRFKKTDINKCMVRNLNRGFTHTLERIPDGYSTYIGVDLGVRTSSDADPTSIFTIIVHPNEDRELLSIEAGRWPGPEIVRRIIDHNHRYKPVTVMVENNAAQEFIVQFTKKLSAVPVRSFTTTGQNIRNHQYGLESLATEMYNEKWIIPSHGHDQPAHPEIRKLVDEMLYYDPNGHPGDRLMSMWFAREAARAARPKAALRQVDLLRR